MKNTIKKILKEDFDWADNINPISKSEIAGELKGLIDYGYNITEDGEYLVDSIYKLGLTKEKVKDLISSLYSLSERTFFNGFDNGESRGYEDAYSNAYEDALTQVSQENEDEIESKFIEREQKVINDSYEEGYNEGYDEGYQKGYDEGYEESYYKGFEKGVSYQMGIDNGEIN